MDESTFMKEWADANCAIPNLEFVPLITEQELLSSIPQELTGIVATKVTNLLFTTIPGGLEVYKDAAPALTLTGAREPMPRFPRPAAPAAPAEPPAEPAPPRPLDPVASIMRRRFGPLQTNGTSEGYFVVPIQDQERIRAQMSTSTTSTSTTSLSRVPLPAAASAPWPDRSAVAQCRSVGDDSVVRTWTVDGLVRAGLVAGEEGVQQWLMIRKELQHKSPLSDVISTHYDADTGVIVSIDRSTGLPLAPVLTQGLSAPAARALALGLVSAVHTLHKSTVSAAPSLKFAFGGVLTPASVSVSETGAYINDYTRPAAGWVRAHPILLGDADWTAPEVVGRPPTTQAAAQAADIYCIGLIVHAALTGGVRSGRPAALPSNVPAEAVDFICQALAAPGDRPTIDALKNHKWLHDDATKDVEELWQAVQAADK